MSAGVTQITKNVILRERFDWLSVNSASEEALISETGTLRSSASLRTAAQGEMKKRC
jgi:hypothetical protein